jgi:hypothetical protein
VIQQAQNIARATLAACASFQALVGAEAADEEYRIVQALEHIYHDAFPSPESQRAEHTRAELTALRPCAIVYTEDNQGWVVERDAVGNEDCWNAYGQVHLVVFRNVPEEDEYDPSKVDTDFRTVIGNIAAEIIGLSETAPYLAANRIVVSGPHRTSLTELKDIGDAQQAELIVSWGPSR